METARERPVFRRNIQPGAASIKTMDVLKDLQHSVRMFRQTPGFTIAAIGALALGIGANTAIFSVVNTVLLKPLAFSDPERIVVFQNTFKQGGRSQGASPNEYNFWRAQTGSFQNVSAYAFNVANLTGESFPEQIQATRASADFFRLCGADVLRGRTYTHEEDLPKAPKTAVLAYAFWQRHFGGDPQAIGKEITLSGERYEIIGVVGPNLKIEIDEPPDVYIPFQLDPERDDNGHYFTVIGRLKADASLAQANAQLQAAYAQYREKHTIPFDYPQTGFAAQPLQDAIVGGVKTSLLILAGAVSFVLLIACANVANLLLARATGRKREIAIRAAVGAGRGRIVRQLLTESVLLSVAGGVLGFAAGYAGIRAILSFSPGNIPRIGLQGSSVSLDWRVLAFTLGLSLATGILFGLAPALQTSRTDLSSTLKESSNRSGTGFRHNKTRSLLVTTEMALALVLLVGAALLIRTFVAIRQVTPGFDAHNVLTMRMSLTGPQFEKAAGVARLAREGLRRLNALPGVEAAAATCCVPLEGGFGLPFEIVGRPAGPTARGGGGWTMVSAGYFETFKVPVLRGRTFRGQDDNGRPVVIINQALAKQFWPKSDPLADQIIIGRGVGPAFNTEGPRQIIGVVSDVRDGALNREARPNMYVLPAQITDGENQLVSQITPWAWAVRTKVAPMSLNSAIQKELREASGGLPVARVRTMEETISRSTAPQNFNMLVLTIFGCAALLLAAIGIYGLMAYSVAQRTQEIGIRLALGAGSSTVRRMVVFQGMQLALVGVAIGLGAAFGLTRLIASLLFGVKAYDPLVFSGAPAVLIGVALGAVWLPALRASRVDPIEALRYE